MFEKLLANLPYNPNLTKQFAFYARRLKREESIRRTGIIFMVLAFTVQFLAFLSPPQPTTAFSSSDMINGGVNSKEGAVNACRKNIKNYGDALWNFKITCDDIARMTQTTVRSTDYDHRLFSMGWLPYGSTNTRSGKPTDETPLNLAKVSDTLFARRLSSFDTGPYSTYQVLKGTVDGRTVFIMMDCGNLLMIGVPEPAPTCRYQGNIYYRGDKRCNPPTAVVSGPFCAHNINLKPNDPRCKPDPVCPYNKKLERKDPRCKPDPTCPYNKDIKRDSPRCLPPETCPFDAGIPKTSQQCIPCPYNQDIPKSDAQCKPCDAAVSSANGLACMVESKVASNQTQNITDANGTTAQPNDVIVYTLFAENQGKKAVEQFIMQENLSDVLDYADVVDLGRGKISESGLVSWPATSVKPGSKLSHKITVRVKNPLPTNSPSAGDPNHFDHIMTNVYGNTVSINLPLPAGVAPVAVVSSSETLPKTGPAESLALVAAVIIVAAYFFARTRLLTDESMIIVQHKTSGAM